MHFLADLQDLNAAFLALIRHPEATAAGWRLLELDPGVAEGIRVLEPDAVAFLAGMPGLLAGFAPPCRGVADTADSCLPADWRRAIAVFAATLQTYLWQAGRRDRLAARLCLGVAAAARADPADVGLPDPVELAGGGPASRLRARYGQHPRLWPQLLRAARQRDAALRELCRLDLIALGILS